MKLSRVEMKNVLGGTRDPGLPGGPVGGGGDVCADECSKDSDCRSDDYCKSIGTSPDYCPDKKTKYVCYPTGL